MIKASEETKVFETGAVRGVTKGMPSLMPLDVIGELVGDRVYQMIEELKVKWNTTDFVITAKELLWAVLTEWGLSVTDMVLILSEHFENGLKKYGKDNWKKGIPPSSYIDSMVRHYAKAEDNWDDEDHKAAFIWNLVCLVWTIENGGEYDED